MKYLLDTNVISEIQKPNYNENVKQFIDMTNPKDLFLSAFTIGELCYGIEKLPVNKKKHELNVWLYTKIIKWFDKRILEIDTEIMVTWGKLRARTGRTLPLDDSLIAAIAIFNNLTLVTRNTKDYEDIEGLSLLNPWEF
jgi:predicted nucleic acid-binding protein